MKFLKIKNNSKKLKFYMYFFILLICSNNLLAFGSENKKYLFKTRHNNFDFEKVYNQNSVSFSEYDNFSNQIRTFLGLYSMKTEKPYFPDLWIIHDSESIRQIYKSKINNMTINKKNYKIGSKSFFSD